MRTTKQEAPATCATEWRPIPEFEEYEISPTGIVRNRTTGRILKPRTISGQKQVALTRNGKAVRISVSRLTARAYPIPRKQNAPI